MKSKIAKLIAVAIVGGIVMAVGEPFVPGGYKIMFFVVCGGLMGVAISTLLMKSTPDMR